ncbi:uncharacterized protein I303_103896 [Kwoniella dejecticola CBS 10117]|uniref:Uncharacterized protein n=1 Tax=Kwoniella dejecticola CBS 10117 TaxID=1296121 RepID=A0A1A6A818_9TREE|nr:uncharacterized protein I303_03915 [Kwoniella dejecticola CBS 10117]OBR86195.1 hypothetical protein I303_03915 [Kwoniella dejecticola CBS 10117]
MTVEDTKPQVRFIDSPEFLKLRVPGHNKLYMSVSNYGRTNIRSILNWAEDNKFYGFAMHNTGKAIYVIAAQNHPFEKERFEKWVNYHFRNGKHQYNPT